MAQNVYRGTASTVVGTPNYAVSTTTITDTSLAGVAGNELLHLFGNFNGSVSAPSGTTLTVDGSATGVAANASSAREAIATTGPTTARTWNNAVSTGR